jgi:hypothetical protein
LLRHLPSPLVRVDTFNPLVRLADAYNRSGDQKEAEKNLEKAKDIYATHGEKKAAEKVNENIRTIRTERGADRKSETNAPVIRRQP